VFAVIPLRVPVVVMDAASAGRLQIEMQDEMRRLSDVGRKLNSLLLQRQKLLTQQNENEMVEKELTGLRDEDGVVWKLVGPVLLKVDVDEAKANVSSRIKWFKDEIGRLERQQKELDESRKAAQDKISRIQERARKAQQEAVQRQVGKA